MVIFIESPGKIKSITKYTGGRVVASFGHFKDLPAKEMGVDLDTFEPTFIAEDAQRQKKVAEIKAAAKDQIVYIATDADREGDAIAAFIYFEIKHLATKIYRMTFLEVNQEAILKGMEEAHDFKDFNWNRYDSFLARRVLDRVVGYTLSPLMQKQTNWAAIREDPKDFMSVGRVQTSGVKMIVDRENEIENFEPVPYINIVAHLDKSGTPVKSFHCDNRFFDTDLGSKTFNSIAGTQTATVESVETKDSISKPKAPYITSTFQQDASSKLGLNPKQSMYIAQKLYEGDENGGWITYMRTDSTLLSSEFLNAASVYLTNKYGSFFKETKQWNSGKSKGAQEAHEAIRPTINLNNLESTKKLIYSKFIGSGESPKVAEKGVEAFELIFNRTLASQMMPSVSDKTTVLFNIGGENFTASGMVPKFAGYKALFNDEDEESKSESEEAKLPAFTVGETVPVETVEKEILATEPPSRYTEAGFIRELEKRGIGRPATYAPTLSLITTKAFAIVKKKVLHPTEKSRILINELKKEHAWLIDYSFTAEMESDLDIVAEGDKKWKEVVDAAYEKMGRIKPAGRQVSDKMKDLARKVGGIKNIPITDEQLNNFDFVSAFIKENMDMTPSQKQLDFAISISEKTNKALPDPCRTNYEALSKWIDSNKKFMPKFLSDKQKDVIINNADEQIIEDLQSGSVEGINAAAAWLDNYFKKSRSKPAKKEREENYSPL